MFSGQSVLGVSAAGIYVLVMLGCLAASIFASQSRAPASHVRKWAVIAILFAGLIAVRALNLEEIVRQDFRSWLRAEDIYQNRREIQRPLVAIVILIAAPLAFLLVYRLATRRYSHRELALTAAVLAAVAMLGVMVLRIISLHQIDMLLYGTFKLNWIADIGASFVVLGAAVIYIRLGKRAR